jgi:TRAP-type mannitol/chloroaromatic compound transport system substrate-binding protein
MNHQSHHFSRRKFLKAGTFVAAAATGSLAMPNVVTAQSPNVLKMQTSWPATEVFTDMARQYVDRVQSMSAGRLKIDLLPAGAVVGAFQVQDAVTDGAIDAAHTVPVYWYGKHKAASLFGTGPVWGGNAANLLAWFYAGGGRELYRELTQDILGLNIVGFFGFPMPAQPLGWFKKPITSIDDMRGLKYRTVGLAGDLMQAMGVTVIQLPPSDVLPAMQRGVIDAFEINNPTSDMSFGAQDVAKNYMLGSYHQASEAFEFMFNRERFERLDPDLQAILQYAAESASTANYALALDRYSEDLGRLQSEKGVTVHKTPESILQAQLTAWDELIKQLEGDEFMKRVMDSQRQWVERTVFYEIANAPNYRLAYEHYFPGKITF